MQPQPPRASTSTALRRAIGRGGFFSLAFGAIVGSGFPKDMILIPGVIETTSNFVEHPEVVARRIEEAVAAVGDRERVVASTDCGFGTFTRREWVIEPVVWLKLAAIRQGADIASARLWGKKAA